MADMQQPKTANGVSREEGGLEPILKDVPSSATPELKGNQLQFRQLGYPTVTKSLITAFNEVRDKLSVEKGNIFGKLDCVGEINKKTDEAYGIVFRAYEKISRLADKSNTDARIRKVHLAIIGLFFKLTPERTNEVIIKLIDVSNRILTGEFGLKSDKAIYDAAVLFKNSGYAFTRGHSVTTNFSPSAIKDLVDNSEGYFVHALIHESIHRVTSFGSEFQAFDIYDFDPKFDDLTLDEQLINPDSYTKLFIQLG